MVRDISLDEKYLLSYFDEEWDKDDVIKFIDVLLSCRYLFDKYVIKSSTLRAEDEHWSLWKIIKGNQVTIIIKILLVVINLNQMIQIQMNKQKMQSCCFQCSMFLTHLVFTKTGCMLYYVGYLRIKII